MTERTKFGAHIFLWTDRWSDDCLPLIDHARSLGLDCLDISVGDDVHFNPKLIRRRAESAGLQLLISPGNLWPMQCDISGDDPDNRKRGLVWHKKNIDLAVEVGALAYTGALYGHAGRVERRQPPEDEFPRTAENLHSLAEHAQKAGVALVLEPMSHFRTHLVNTPEQVMRLIALADHPNLKVLLDTYHLVTEVRDYAAAIKRVGDKLWGIHACESDRGVPGGGLVPWHSVFAALCRLDWSGPMILETYNSSVSDFACQRAMFHNVCPDGDQFVRDGLAFLKSHLQNPPHAESSGRE
jgi:D-psicose/D-tagatose/L-ribulose 3-epimerase